MSSNNGRTEAGAAPAGAVAGGAANSGAAKGGAKGAAANGGASKVRKGPMFLGRIVLAAAALAALCYGGLWLLDQAAFVSTDDAAIDGRQVKLSSKMLGRIAEVSAAEGDRVKAGQVLVALDGKDLKAQEAQAIASLAYARQNLEVARIGLDKSREDYDRTSRLYSGDAATKESYEHAQRALDTARAQLSLAQASVDSAQAQLGVIEAQLLNLSIASPIDGTVEKLTLYPGDLAQPGQTILSVNNLDSIWVTANYEETKVGRIRAGAKALVSVDAYPGRTFEGKVEMIRAGIVPPAFQVGEFTKTTQRVPVKIVLDSIPAEATLLPGMSVEAKIRTDAVLPAFAERLHL